MTNEETSEDQIRAAIATGAELQFTLADGWVLYGRPLSIDARGGVVIRARGGAALETRWLSTIRSVCPVAELGRSEVAREGAAA
jgi:hypothetical protein